MGSQNTKRDSGKNVQQGNINAGKAIGDVVRTCLGPRAMLKMLMDPMGGIMVTWDGNAILREITVQHPAAKTLIEIARTQDEEVGDGTTSVIVLAAEILGISAQYLEDKMHPTVIIDAYRQCLEDAVTFLRDNVAEPVDINDESALIKVIQSCIGTKFISKWSDLACQIAIRAVKTVAMEQKEGMISEIDTKRYAKIEKIPGGTIEESQVLSGVMFNKDVVHPKMKRRIENPRVLLLDCNLEYKKGESQTNIEIMKEEDFSKALEAEEAYIKKICDEIIAFKPDLVITEKGVSDLAQHFFNKAGITAVRRLRKSDNLRVARACGATIVNRTDEITSGLEVIPRTLAQNCGANTIRTLTALRAKHANEEEKNVNWGINGESGELADMSALGIWEPLSVKLQVYKTAIETAILLLRIDDIVSGSKKKGDVGAQGPAVDHGAAPPDMPEM